MSPPNIDFTDAPRTPEEAAAVWFGLKRSGTMTDAEVREFEVWALEPDNRAAYDNLELYWLVAAAVRNDPQVLALRDEAARTWRLGRRLWIGGALAASLAIAIVGGLAAIQWPAPGGSGSAQRPALAQRIFGQSQTFRTSVGQTTSVLLPDGSTVTLDTDTVIRAKLNGEERRLVLEKGRAFFRVAKDKTRPFVVLAAGRTITATGTAFDVRADPDNFEVTLVEGRVRVEDPVRPKAGQPPQVTEMIAGSQLVADEKRWTIAEADLPKQTSWLSGRLTFDNEPLSQVVAEMNRYSDKKIVLAGPGVGEAPILGVFKAGDVDAFVRALEEYKLAKVVGETDRDIIIGAL